MADALLCLSLLLTGLLAGTYAGNLVHDHAIGLLDAETFTRMHQMRDRSFRMVMPPVALLTLGSLLAGALTAGSAARPALLLAAAATVADIALAVTRQVPLNRQVEHWAPGRIPADWAGLRDRWQRQHLWRSALMLAAFLATIAATRI